MTIAETRAGPHSGADMDGGAKVLDRYGLIRHLPYGPSTRGAIAPPVIILDREGLEERFGWYRGRGLDLRAGTARWYKVFATTSDSSACRRILCTRSR